MATAPAACGGAVTVIDVEVDEITAAAAPPKLTLAPAAKLAPEMVTAVPPRSGPLDGVAELTAGGGGATYVNAPASVAERPSGFVTVTLTRPATCAGAVAEMETAETLPTAAAVPPTVTVAPVWKFAPEMTSAVPPAVGPLAGDTEAMEGGGGGGATKVKPAVSVADWPSPFTTTTSAAPAAWAGVVIESDVALRAETIDAEPPMVTLAPASKPVPETIAEVPPSVVPDEGAMPAMEGGGGGGAT